MRISTLLKYIDEHNFLAVELSTGMILAEEQFAADDAVLAANGHYGPYWTLIPPTLADARDWLGY